MSVILACFFIWTVVNSLFLVPLPKRSVFTDRPLVSVLVPLRNEERNVKRLVRSLKQLTYEPIEFLLLDDQSTDRTYEFLLQETKGDDRFTLLQGKALPDGWAGKVHACHQLAQQANGAYLFFIDADVELKPTVIEALLTVATTYHAKLVTGFPSFHPKSLPLVGKWLVPLQHFLFSFICRSFSPTIRTCGQQRRRMELVYFSSAPLMKRSVAMRPSSKSLLKM
ncbi:4,4'-diaponeurosporenoate glycosyltransferase [Anoxybacillus sp. BCO1]|nr:4,4'-diaponeurosporenoate glycosyltransferase [Anoxybacillus sp. BCO1]